MKRQILNLHRLLLLSGFFIAGCTSNPQQVTNSYCHSKYPFKEIEYENSNVSLHDFSQVTQWVKKNKLPVVSILLSVKGKVIYEFYAVNSDRETSRNTMSVTKSITSALMGIALDRGLISSPDNSIVDYLPPPIPKDVFDKLKSIRIKDVMAMSALDASTWPKSIKPVFERAKNFHLSLNRYKFAINQKIVKLPGKDFVYSDVTPALISAALQNVTHKNLFDFANLNLFQPMRFKAQGWLFRDASGYDNAAYGLQLRPIDMHKFGILYLNQGCWADKQLVSSTWVRQSLMPLTKSHPDQSKFDYGWFWWKHELKPGWKAHLAKGWHGQRLAILPEKAIVISITANATDKYEKKNIKKIFDLLINAVEHSAVIQ